MPRLPPRSCGQDEVGWTPHTRFVEHFQKNHATEIRVVHLRVFSSLNMTFCCFDYPSICLLHCLLVLENTSFRGDDFSSGLVFLRWCFVGTDLFGQICGRFRVCRFSLDRETATSYDGHSISMENSEIRPRKRKTDLIS